MNNSDLYKRLIHTTLTLNSTTLYTYENAQLIHGINSINCSELVSQELGLINASKTLVGSIPISTSSKVTNTKLLLYFMKKNSSNSDGLSDMITVVTIAHANVNKTLILTILKKITDKYIDFRQDSKIDPGPSKLGEFKLYMNQIIKFEEMNYDSNQHVYEYGRNSETDPLLASEVINPNQLLLANEEVDEVRQLMLENINKLLSRGDKINLLVDQTDRLTTSSLLFQKRAQQIKKKMWLSKWRFILLLSGVIVFIMYILVGSHCGYPIFDRCT